MPRIESPADLGAAWNQRSVAYGQQNKVVDDLLGIYNGDLPNEFDDYFHQDMHVHLINAIRLSWDDLANLAGKEFPIFVEPDNDKPTAKQRAEKQEKIGYGYNRAGRIVGGISMKMLMKILAWWLVGTANAVAMVLPSYQHQMPYFTFRDSRTHYPPVGWSPFTQAAAEDALFAYSMSLAELKARYPDKAAELGRSRPSTYGYTRRRLNDDETFLMMGEYYSRDTWMVATLEDRVVILARSDQGDPEHPGVQPARAFSLYTGGGAKGRSMFADQVSIQAAMARMFSQKLDYFDRTLYPLIFHTPLVGKTIRIGPYATNQFDLDQHPGVTPRVDVVAPQNPIDADQAMAFALGLSRMLNRNPESFQGQGEANSAKAISQLQAGVNQTIQQGIWPSFIEGLPSLYAAAAEMDVNLWGNVAKKARGKRKNAAFSVNYRPNVDLRGREHDFEIEQGVGLAGYQGTLEILQLVGAELMSEDTALEQLEGVQAPQEEKRKIQANRMEKLTWADLQSKAANGQLKPGAFAELRRRTQAGDDLFDVIAELEGQDRLYIMPQAPEMAPPGAAGPGGGLSALAPTLEALRGR